MKISNISIVILLLLNTAVPASGSIITGVLAPDLFRPTDGVAYPFTIKVNGVYERGEGGGVMIDVFYWDWDAPGRHPNRFDDQIDGVVAALVLPGGAPGAAWGPIDVVLEVGCTTGGEVFGPFGLTGEGPMKNDGFFQFLGQTSPVWGYNSVFCRSGGRPRSSGLKKMAEIGISVTDEVSHSSTIPEPSTLALLSLGLAALLLQRNRRPLAFVEQNLHS